MARTSSPDLFSINAAADALGRTRRTVTRALKNTKPDGIKSGLKKWKMKTIISAIDRNSQAPINDPRTMSNESTALDRETQAAFKLFDAPFDAMMNATPLAKQREFAKQAGPLLVAALELMRERDTADGLHEEHVLLRANQIYVMTLKMMERACEWEGTSNAFNLLNPETEDEAEED